MTKQASCNEASENKINVEIHYNHWGGITALCVSMYEACREASMNEIYNIPPTTQPPRTHNTPQQSSRVSKINVEIHHNHQITQHTTKITDGTT